MGKGRAPCCDKSKVKRGPWSPQEDLRLITFIQQNGHANWRSLPREAGLLRCGKSCRLRWINYLRPDLKRGNFTAEEEETIIRLHHDLGNKWSQIASCLPGRTDNEIKNVWHTHLKKKLHSKKENHTNHHKDETHNLSKSSSISLSSSTSSISIVSPRRNQSTKDGIEEEKQENDALNENSSTSNSSSEINHCPNSGNFDVDFKRREDIDILFNNTYEENYELVQHPGQDMQNFPFDIDLGFWEMLDKEDPTCTYQLQTNEFEICQSDYKEENDKEKECMRWMKELEQELFVETTGEGDQDLSQDICPQFLSSPSHFN